MTSDTQTAYLLAIAFDLLPPKSAKRAADYLASYIESVGHLTTGFVGTPLLCKTLSDNGRADLAFKCLCGKNILRGFIPLRKGLQQYESGGMEFNQMETFKIRQ